MRGKMYLWTFSFLLLFVGAVPVAAADFEFDTPGTLIGSFNSSLIDEASGLAVSRKNTNVMYTENDSGGGPKVYSINTDGDLLGIYTLDGASNIDWEDMAIGPGPSTGVNYVYIGDIGDNSANRDGTTRAHAAIYRTPEPTVTGASNPPDPNTVGTTNIGSSNWEKIIIQYPGGPTNAEAMMIDPVTGDLFLVMKGHTASDPALQNRVYKATQAQLDAHANTGTILTLTQVALVTARVNSVRTVGPTAADISEDGRMIIVKNLEEAFVWPRESGQSVDTVLSNDPDAPVYVPVAVGQTGVVGDGETVAFALDGSKFYTVVENGNFFGYFNKVSTDTTPPTAPSNVHAASATSTTIDLAWNASTDSGGSGLDSYHIYKNGSFLHDVSASTTSYTVTGLSPSTSYSFYVVAEDGAGNTATSSTVGLSTAATTKADNLDASIVYHGSSWETRNTAQDYNGSVQTATDTGDYAQFSFNGVSIKYVGRTCPSCGKVDVYIDGVLVGNDIDVYSATTQFQHLIYSNSSLTPGSHTIKIVVTGLKNANSGGKAIHFDYFEY
jgi:hypothetical protein